MGEVKGPLEVCGERVLDGADYVELMNAIEERTVLKWDTPGKDLVGHTEFHLNGWIIASGDICTSKDHVTIWRLRSIHVLGGLKAHGAGVLRVGER